MKIFSLLLLTAFAFSAHADSIGILSLDDVAVAQLNEDGSYSVICMNGNRELVSDVDVRLGNVCPNANTVVTGILSLQKRSDGDFDVVCRDLTKLVATTSQIANDEVCKIEAPTPYVIEDGIYETGGGYSDCEISSTYEDGELIGMRVSFGSSTVSDMTCEGVTCTGTFAGYSSSYRVVVTSTTSFDFSNTNNTYTTSYTKKNQ